MEDRLQVVLLLDYYGKLLSKKQYTAMTSYYYEDLSLIEIAKNQKITKQAVSDLIRRSEKKLYEIENELNMVNRNVELRKKLELLNDDFESLYDIISNSECIEKMENIHKRLNTIISKII